VADHLETRSSPTCYHTTFRRSGSNRLRIGVQKISRCWGPASLGWGVRGWPLRDTLLHHLCYVTMPNLVILGQTIRA